MEKLQRLVLEDLQRARELADKITDDPMATTHADNIKKAVEIINAALQNLQQAKYPELGAEAKKVLAASSNINIAELTLDQKETVKTYFKDAALLLQKMN